MTPNETNALAPGRQPHRGQALVEFALVAPILFVMLIAIIEAGVFVLNMETLNNATREGARYAIVHGSESNCPSGPMPGGATNPCDPDGARIQAAVRSAAIGLVSIGDLSVSEPRWTVGGSPDLPSSADDDTTPPGTNDRGEYVTVFADYAYRPLIGVVFDTDLIPSITLSARSSLVINY